jgi:MraZ protein
LDSFLGSYDHLVDAKARVTLPRLFKRILGVKEKGREPHLILSKGFDGCLFGFSEASWPRFEKALVDSKIEDKDERAAAREIAESLCPAPIDTVGRVVIPSSHLELGGLSKGKPVKILGMIWYFEIWDAKAYESYRSSTTSKESYEVRARKLFKS